MDFWLSFKGRSTGTDGKLSPQFVSPGSSKLALEFYKVYDTTTLKDCWLSFKGRSTGKEGKLSLRLIPPDSSKLALEFYSVYGILFQYTTMRELNGLCICLYILWGMGCNIS